MKTAASIALILGLLLPALPAAAQGAGTASAPCSVRIRPQAAAEYDLSTEVVLTGTVADLQGSTLRLRLPYGTVRVDLGSAASAASVKVGDPVQVTASKRTEGLSQRFVARELRGAGATVVIRDAQGVPVQG
jgi:hypothetical protein